MKKTEIKAGRSVSAIGIIMGIVAIVFGIFWINMLLRLSSEDNEMEPGVIFLLVFGVMFVILAIAITVFHARNTYVKNRPSILDIEEVIGEEKNTEAKPENLATPDGGINFCPYCGKPFKKDFSFCQYCGKKAGIAV
ncbi:MAG: zinc ribbon domain-containing protein [Candidatus Aminicenantes bacterium]|nr:zinc ribbon domain-containing protein [Candidatus Aminicenantes bacterium]